MKLFSKKRGGHRPDYAFLACVGIITIFGFAMLSSASSDTGKIKFDDTFYYLKHQLMYGLSLGIAGFIAGSLLHYRWWKRLAPALLGIGLVMLLLVFTPLGFSHGGAARWITVGPLSIQPAEIMKFAFVLYLAAWLSAKRSASFESAGVRQTSLTAGLLPFLVLSGIVATLLILQPSTTAVVIILTAGLFVYFVSGARLTFIAGIAAMGIAALMLIIYITPYRFERIAAFFNPEANPQSVNYQLSQALTSIGSGGVWGVGFGQSVSKYKYLPEPIGDSMFAVIAEELGFAGALGVIVLFMGMGVSAFKIARQSTDQFAKLTVVGFISIIMIQAFIHIAAISGVTPLTGIPLPFISYGGTSLAVFLTMAGIIVNISKYT